MEEIPARAQLWVQLLVSAGFVVLMVIVHGLGLLGISRFLAIDPDRLERRKLSFGALGLVASTGLLLFVLHIVEIAIFAFFFLWVDTHINTLDDAIYYSASAYATLGTTDATIPAQWRLIGAFEALIGFVLIGWSTAFVARMMSRLRD